MFKHYLTYQLVLSFDRTCRSLDVAPPVRDRVLRSATQIVHHMARAIHTVDPKEESQFLFVALQATRDCREIFSENQITQFEALAQWEVLHQKLEALCWRAAEKEGGQLRMLG